MGWLASGGGGGGGGSWGAHAVGSDHITVIKLFCLPTNLSLGTVFFIDAVQVQFVQSNL